MNSTNDKVVICVVSNLIVILLPKCQPRSAHRPNPRNPSQVSFQNLHIISPDKRTIESISHQRVAPSSLMKQRKCSRFSSHPSKQKCSTRRKFSICRFHPIPMKTMALPHKLPVGDRNKGLSVKRHSENAKIKDLAKPNFDSAHALMGKIID